MLAEIIAIGTEITSGVKLDTNSQWLSLQLADLGVPVLFHTTVADDLDANVQVILAAMRRVDLVLITGGLGPTMDDLTREALAAAAGVELVPHTASLEEIERFFRSRGREMPARNRVQAMFPEGSEPLLNPVGTAPGIWMTIPTDGGHVCSLAAMPGVPSEMKKMFFEQVRPRIQGGEVMIRRARINCFGIGESATEELLGDLTQRGNDPEVGITAHEATITLRIIAQGKSEDECQLKIAAASKLIRERLGDRVFGVEDEELEHAVIGKLQEQQLTLATIECATAGMLAERLAHVEEGQGVFQSGLVLPALHASLESVARKHAATMNVDLLLCVGAESIQSAADGRPIRSTQIGVLTKAGAWEMEEVTWSGNPAIARSRTAKCALDMLRHWLLATDSVE